jgi:hypothetical protein
MSTAIPRDSTDGDTTLTQSWVGNALLNKPLHKAALMIELLHKIFTYSGPFIGILAVIVIVLAVRAVWRRFRR